MDTIVPDVTLCKSFSRFIQKTLPTLLSDNADNLVLTAAQSPTLPGRVLPGRRANVIVGPEAGWEEEELEAVAAAGFKQISFGARAVPTETALHVLLGRLGIE